MTSDENILNREVLTAGFKKQFELRRGNGIWSSIRHSSFVILHSLFRLRGRHFLALSLLLCPSAPAALIYEVTSPYHHIRVVEEANLRTLCFDDALESRMSVANPLQGHFEYTEYFHMPWLWNTQITSVVMIGLGGASTQRAFEYYYPNVTV